MILLKKGLIIVVIGYRYKYTTCKINNPYELLIGITV